VLPTELKARQLVLRLFELLVGQMSLKEGLAVCVATQHGKVIAAGTLRQTIQQTNSQPNAQRRRHEWIGSVTS